MNPKFPEIYEEVSNWDFDWYEILDTFRYVTTKNKTVSKVMTISESGEIVE